MTNVQFGAFPSTKLDHTALSSAPPHWVAVHPWPVKGIACGAVSTGKWKIKWQGIPIERANLDSFRGRMAHSLHIANAKIFLGRHSRDVVLAYSDPHHRPIAQLIGRWYPWVWPKPFQIWREMQRKSHPRQFSPLGVISHPISTLVTPPSCALDLALHSWNLPFVDFKQNKPIYFC